MQLLLTSPNLTQPTVDTLREYAERRFQKLSRYLPSFAGEHVIKVSVRRNRYMFEVLVEIAIPGKMVFSAKDKDIRKAIDDLYATMKNTVVRKRTKQRGR